jgi:hypothetical protein
MYKRIEVLILHVLYLKGVQMSGQSRIYPKTSLDCTFLV